MNAGGNSNADLDELLDEDDASYVNQRRPRIRTAGVTAGQLSEARRNGMQFEVLGRSIMKWSDFTLYLLLYFDWYANMLGYTSTPC